MVTAIPSGKITAAFLHNLALGGNGELLTQLAPEFVTQLAKSDINTVQRCSHFLAQCCYESWYFTELTENLNYSANRIGQVWPRLAARGKELANDPKALGNAAYAGRNGNQDESSGDGFRFRGRSLLGLTGRRNYALVGSWIDQDLLVHPEMAAYPSIAVQIAIAFWGINSINTAADVNNFEEVTQKINGSTEGLTERIILTKRAAGLFNSHLTLSS